MKKLRYKSLLILLLIFSIGVFGQSEKFYYIKNGKKVFLKATSKKSIQFNNKQQFTNIANGRAKELGLINSPNNIITGNAIEIKNLERNNRKEIFKVSDVYATDDNLELIIFNEIICKGDVLKVDELIKNIPFQIISKKRSKRFLIKILDPNVDILNLSNKLYESNLFEYCYPNFISEITFGKPIEKETKELINTINKNINIQKRLYDFSIQNPNDEYFNKQFYLKNTGQLLNDGHYGTPDADIKALPAWDITKGNPNVVVAVIDEGVTNNHPDLPNTRQVRLNGSNFSGIGSINDPSATGNGNHGNACAGIIAAEQNNGQGISGVSPQTKIMPIKIFGSADSNDIADAIEFAYVNGANVISNSWGYNTSNQNLHPAIIDEIQNAISNNVVVVFAAGNTANHVVSYNGYVTFPANNSQIEGMICAGASNRNDQQANYSPTNSLIEVVAPSHHAYPSQISGESFEVWTIDMPGNNGYNPCNSNCDSPRFSGEFLPSSGTNYQSYTGRMGGTSSSCPQVAAVASLILSLSPNLTPSEIEDLIKESADKVGNYQYINGKSNEMGYGRLNAYEAVLLAQSYGCAENLTITQNVSSGQTDNQEAQNTITTINIINSGGIANYDAGTTVTLKPGFNAKSGSNFRAFIEGCTSAKSATQQMANETISYENNNNDLMEEVLEKESSIKIYPNPVQKTLSIESIKEIQSWSFTNFYGKQFYRGKEKIQTINTQKLPKGIYILRMVLKDGEIITKKVIKN